MFNKTAKAINKIRLKNYSPNNKFRQTLTIKIKPMNLRNSLDNNNKHEYSLESNSNMNIKTTAQSKLGSESSSIQPIQTLPNYKIKKLFFLEEKEKNKNNINKMNKSHYINQSATNGNKFGLNGIFNLKKSNFLFKKNSIRNEITQCEPDNVMHISGLDDLLRKDKIIDKMAKKLVLKLNEDEYYDREKTFRSFHGNNITLKNGFFNGVNLVLNEKDNKKGEEQSKNNNNNTIIKNNNYPIRSKNIITNPNISNKKIFQLNKMSNLPLYLRDKANIQGTEILSPFCKEARDEFLFNKIFNSEFNRKLPKKFELINNKLNIFYAENEYQYDKKLKKFNDKLRLQGKKIIHNVGPTKDQMKLDKIKTTLGFIKKIFDYSYPNMILARVRKQGKNNKRSLTENNIPPYKKAELLAKRKNDFLEKYLRMSIDVQKS